MKEEILVSVIIPTYNGKHKIRKILDSLKVQTFQSFEIIISIDGSIDGTFEYLNAIKNDFSNLIILHEPNGGRAICRNRGAQIANGKYLLFLDDDMRASSSLIEDHLSKHQIHPDSIIVGSTYEDLNLSLTDIQKYRAYLSRKWTDLKSPQLESPYLTAANFSIKKEIFERLGMFDKQLNDAEDYDLAITAFESGIAIYLYPELLGYHDDYITCKSYIKRLREYEFAQKRLKEVKPERYVVKYPFRNTPPLGVIKQVIMYLFSFKVWVFAVDKQWFAWLPVKVKYKIYDLIILSLSNYYKNVPI